jgi:hypothetical protein
MVNKNCPVLLSNLYEYDFQACVYNILKNINWDISDIDKNDKRNRNIKIGLMRRENKVLSNYLERTTENLIDYYLTRNNIKPQMVVLRLKDGVVLTEPMKILNETMPLDFRGVISKLIFSIDKRKWIKIYANGNISVKGISNKFVSKDAFKMFSKFDYTNKHRLISNLEGFRKFILFGNKNKYWYMMKEGDEYVVPILGVGEMKFNNEDIDKICIDDIDRSFLWNDHIWPLVCGIIANSI